jgi:phosphoglycerate kinase
MFLLFYDLKDKTMIKSHLSQWNITKQRVFLRADLNVPCVNGTIDNDFRLRSIIPTLDHLLSHNNTIILATHIGKPEKHDPHLSTKILLPWFEKRGYSIDFAADPLQAAVYPSIPGKIILLENLRFFNGEKSADPFFAKQLKQTADYYVNDAFGTLHRHDCSISLLPYEFSENKRSIGFLVEKEINVLSNLLQAPAHPYLAIMGGGKIGDKIPLIQTLLSAADTVVICPALSFSFMAAQGMNVGKSLVDKAQFSTCQKIELMALQNHKNLIFPSDYQIKYDEQENNLSVCKQNEFPANAVGISIGPDTLEQVKTLIHNAKTIFFNCAMGMAEEPQTTAHTQILLTAIAQSSAHTIVAGGDTVALALKNSHHTNITHVSTGGGASISFITGILLPGLLPFEDE